MTVWVVETGADRDRGVVLVALSLEAAVAAVKGDYDDVDGWRLRQDRWQKPHGEWTLSGRYRPAAGRALATRAAEFSIVPFEVDGDGNLGAAQGDEKGER